MANRTTADCVIIGAGFAGAATAYHLTRNGARDIVILEQEAVPGVHSSGRNASMVRQVVADAALAKLTEEGAAFLRSPPADFPESPRFEPNGSLLLASGEGWRRLARDAEMARGLGMSAECWTRERAVEHVPPLEGAEFEGAVWSATDGVVDIHALLTGYLKAARSAGAEIRYRTRVRAIDVHGGRVSAVVTDDGAIKTEKVVDAAGPWALTVAGLAGAVDAPLHPCRRHLYITSPIASVDRKWPFVWDVTHEFYFRPDSGGLLLCPCDQEEMAPCDAQTDEAVAEILFEKIRRYLPTLSDVAIRKHWAGLRTLSADGRFVIGPDPKVKGFFWVAGLGGHGVTTSSAVGALAARMIMGSDAAAAEAFSPARFAA
ncbi:MAG TPA: FAD-dependent oxidoreductase [Candidatus Binatia bacterium]|jgi:D-arginine dehydrogenase